MDDFANVLALYVKNQVSFLPPSSFPSTSGANGSELNRKELNRPPPRILIHPFSVFYTYSTILSHPPVIMMMTIIIVVIAFVFGTSIGPIGKGRRAS